MAAGQVTRSVAIRLTVEPDSRNGQNVSKVENDIKRAYGLRQTLAEKSATAAQKAAERASAAESKAAERAANEQQKQQERVFKNRVKLLADIGKQEERRAHEAERQAERAAQAAERSSQRQAAAVERAVRQEEQARQRLIRSVDTYSRRLLSAEVRQERMSLSMLRSSTHLFHGFAHVAEGLSLIGITSEEDTAKFIKMYAAVQGISDTFRGLVGIMTSVVHLTSQYERAMRAAADAEKIELALHTARAALGVGAAPGGGLVGAAANVGTTAAGAAVGQRLVAGAEEGVGRGIVTDIGIGNEHCLMFRPTVPERATAPSRDSG